ncbi:hypothetical protein DLAC_05785 [Tieghemostelium lacteum]|uniref:B box-type domain-containing protein n=1 Tax=Tieghemostelium lacteum TaxID=361077 RepID=A0A151ZGQ5_TIELA|nr:hypothetical protein DLAC_05785 [Tieghemostelium lacteum]|eukprot:KYQ93152.1 hypothetical protein DLAC_05785 [Tieghemostelium lacteum]
MEKCTKTQHINPIIIVYCVDCKQGLCEKCLPDHEIHKLDEIHRVHQVALESHRKKLKKNLKNLLKFSQQNKAEYKEIEDTYEKQIEKITSKFRELHDQLHIQEVSLKRELKSYYEENTETYVTSLSAIDMEIKEVQDAKKHYKKLIKENNNTINNINNNNNNEEIEIDPHIFENLDLVENYVKRDGIRKSIYYHKYEAKTPEVDYSMIGLVNKSYYQQYLYKLHNEIKEMVRINLETSKKDVFVFTERHFKENSYFIHHTTAGNYFYCFYNNSRYRRTQIEPFESHPWKMVVFHQRDYLLVSIVFDNRKTIYFLGSYREGDRNFYDLLSININDTTDTKMVWSGSNLTLNTKYNFKLVIDIKGENIYVLGFDVQLLYTIYHIPLGNLNGILECYKIKSNVTVDCFDGVDKIYILSNRPELSFISYSISERKLANLPPPNIDPKHYRMEFKFLYDNYSSLVMHYVSKNSNPEFNYLHKYNINQKSWAKSLIIDNQIN